MVGRRGVGEWRGQYDQVKGQSPKIKAFQGEEAGSRGGLCAGVLAVKSSKKDATSHHESALKTWKNVLEIA